MYQVIVVKLVQPGEVDHCGERTPQNMKDYDIYNGV